MLDFLLTRLKKDARIVMCGAISAYSKFTTAILDQHC